MVHRSKTPWPHLDCDVTVKSVTRITLNSAHDHRVEESVSNTIALSSILVEQREPNQRHHYSPLNSVLVATSQNQVLGPEPKLKPGPPLCTDQHHKVLALVDQTPESAKILRQDRLEMIF